MLKPHSIFVSSTLSRTLRHAALPVLLMLAPAALHAAATAGAAPASSGRLIPIAAPAPANAAQAGPGESLALPAAANQTISAGSAAGADQDSAAAPIVAMLDFESSTLSPEQVQALSAALFTRIAIRGGVRLLPREATRAWLIRNDLYPTMPYQAPVSLERVAHALQADQVVTGRIDQVKNAWNFELDLQKQQEAQPRQIALVRLGGLDDVMLLMDKAAAQTHAAALNELVEPIDTGDKDAQRVSVKLKMAAPLKKKIAATDHQVVEMQDHPRAHARGEKMLAEARLMDESTLGASKPEDIEPAKPVAVVPTAPATAKRHKILQPSPAQSAAAAPSAPLAEAPHAAPPAPAALAPNPQDLYRQALALDRSNPERLPRLEQAAALAPGDADIQMHLANEYYSREQFAKAAAACDKALASRPNDSMLQTIKGSALFELHKYAEARDAHAAAVKADPNNNWARYNYALAVSQLHAPEAPAAWRDYISHAQNDPTQAALLDRAREQLAALQPPAPTAPAPAAQTP